MKNEFKKQDIPQLEKNISDMRESLRVFRFAGAGSRTRNVREGRNMRRDVARALTELRMQNLSAAKAGIASEAKKA